MLQKKYEMEISEGKKMEAIEMPGSLGINTPGTSENLGRGVPDIKNKWLYIGIPAIAIAFAETFMYLGRITEAAEIHAAVLLTLSFSIMFIKDREIGKTYQAFILLPIFRLINLSMPIFYETTLYSLIFIYSLLAIPASIAATNQDFTEKQLGLTFDKIFIQIPFAILIGLLLGAGEYQIIRTNYLIPDFSLFNLLILSIVMVFFVGLVEEIIFRSVLQNRLEIVFGAKIGIIVTSILFGLMHSGYGSITEVIYTTFVGIFIGYLFYKTRSLPLVVMIHGFINVFLFGVFPFLF